MKNKRMRYISITAAILLVFVLLMLLFSNRSGDFSTMEAQDGVLDATSADFSSAVYEIDGEWTFYPEVLGSGAELDAAQPGERDESIPYGSYRLKIHAQPKQYLTLGGYSFDYSTRVLVNGSEVLEIGKVGASAAESEPRIDYMLIPIYTGEDGTVEVVCQYANFVHREGGGLTQMHLSTAENIDHMRRSRNLYSLVLGGSLCLFGMYFLLFAVFQGEIKYVFLAVICALLGLRDQNFYVLHLLPANYNWAVPYRFLVLMITLQPCFLLLLLQSLYEKLAKPIVVRCYAVLYAVLAAAHFILPTQDIAPLSRIGYYLSMPFFLYLVVQLIRRFWRIRRLEWDDVLVLLGYLLLLGSNVYEAVFGRIVTTITRHGAAPPYLLVFVFLIAGAISLKINRREQELSESRRQREVLTQLNRLKSEFLHQMAHELKTPLTVMSGYAQLTDWQLGTGAVSADAHEHMQTISSEAQRLSALVSRLIDLANGGSPDIEMGVIDAAQLVEDFLVLVLLGHRICFFDLGFLRLFRGRLGGLAGHDETFAAHIQVGFGAEHAVVDAVFQVLAAFFIAARDGVGDIPNVHILRITDNIVDLFAQAAAGANVVRAEQAAHARRGRDKHRHHIRQEPADVLEIPRQGVGQPVGTPRQRGQRAQQQQNARRGQAVGKGHALALFLGIPRCGGSFARALLILLGVDRTELSLLHRWAAAVALGPGTGFLLKAAQLTVFHSGIQADEDKAQRPPHHKANDDGPPGELERAVPGVVFIAVVVVLVAQAAAGVGMVRIRVARMFVFVGHGWLLYGISFSKFFISSLK